MTFLLAIEEKDWNIISNNSKKLETFTFWTPTSTFSSREKIYPQFSSPNSLSSILEKTEDEIKLNYEEIIAFIISDEKLGLNFWCLTKLYKYLFSLFKPLYSTLISCK